MSEKKLAPQELLANEGIRRFGRYLRNLRSYLLAYDVIDRIGKVREIDEFVEALSAAMRLSDNVKARAEREKEAFVFIPSEDDVKNVIELASRGPKALRLVSRYLYALAYTYTSASSQGG